MMVLPCMQQITYSIDDGEFDITQLNTHSKRLGSSITTISS